MPRKGRCKKSNDRVAWRACWGNYSGDTTAHKILRAGYYWPTLFKDAHAHVRRCDICQRCGGRQPKAAAPLNPVMIMEPFEQWGLDIIGEIKPNSSLQHKYILTATDYFTHWVEAIPLRKINEDEVISFLQDHIMTRFGVPVSLVFYNTKYFHQSNWLLLLMIKG